MASKVLGSSSIAFEIVGIETTSNIPPFTQRYVCNQRAYLDVVLP